MQAGLGCDLSRVSWSDADIDKASLTSGTGPSDLCNACRQRGDCCQQPRHPSHPSGFGPRASHDEHRPGPGGDELEGQPRRQALAADGRQAVAAEDHGRRPGQ